MSMVGVHPFQCFIHARSSISGFLVHTSRLCSLFLEFGVELISLANAWNVEAVPPEVAECCAEACVSIGKRSAERFRTFPDVDQRRRVGWGGQDHLAEMEIAITAWLGHTTSDAEI